MALDPFRAAVAAHLHWCRRTPLPAQLHPAYRRRNPNPEAFSRQTVRHAAINRRYDAYTNPAKLPSPYACQPPSPANIVNHLSPDTGIPTRFFGSEAALK
ncbi:hypothetical protein ACMV_01240 [Acidiphilium multivorum AIU301]|uniref:Uncharacterized protein n=1 Tax=Acidiphilium multivorum (strain DSM 11245 / JCM 8867 / NBRC 100883 / AIU 301) TaxID=926570 RepID=F0J189_ACIMA|nr:hypothetical protein ACMV_01240 [Acidiphilium multivorum AIU301]